MSLRKILCSFAFLFTLVVACGRLESQAVAPSLVHEVTEEGQHVIFDLYTWQRRELSKKLPLDQPWPDDEHLPSFLAKYGLNGTGRVEHIPVPSIILPNIYLVASKPTLTYLLDCGPEGLAIIDPGIEQDYSEIIANVEKLGFSTSRIRWVLNTHAHFDHSASDYLFRKLGAQILIGAADADAVEKGTLVTAFNLAYGPNAPPFPVSVVDRRLSDGEVVHLGNKDLIVIHTPGHTEGSSCFLLRAGDKNVLFSGDTILFDNRLGFQGTGFSDNRAYVQSLEKLAKFHLYQNDQFRWDVLLPGHGTIVLDRAYMDVEKGWHTVELDLLNGSPIEALPFATPDYRVMMYERP